MRMLGHEFRPMDKTDFETFAGADEGCLICELDDVVLIWSERDKVLTEITSDGERDWTVPYEKRRWFVARGERK
jgi:hypothetical protein